MENCHPLVTIIFSIQDGAPETEPINCGKAITTSEIEFHAYKIVLILNTVSAKYISQNKAGKYNFSKRVPASFIVNSLVGS